MHELSIAQNILDIVRDHLPLGKMQMVKAVTIKVGDGAGVVKDSLEFCFNSITAGTPMQETALKIDRVPFIVRCRACGRTSTNESEFFFCTFCEGSDVALVSGDELEVSAIELADEKEGMV